MLCPKDPALQADPQFANAVVDNKVAVPIVVTAVNVRENMFTHLSNVMLRPCLQKPRQFNVIQLLGEYVCFIPSNINLLLTLWIWVIKTQAREYLKPALYTGECKVGSELSKSNLPIDRPLGRHQTPRP